MSAPAAIAVRDLRADDRDAWLALWTGYLGFYRAALPDEVTEATFRRLCAGDQALAGLVAVTAGDEPVGLAHLVFHPTTWAGSDYCYLEDLFVDPAHRGAGAAAALFAAVYERARGRGARRVYWHTQQFNAPARSLYDTVGTPTSFVVYEHIVDER